MLYKCVYTSAVVSHKYVYRESFFDSATYRLNWDRCFKMDTFITATPCFIVSILNSDFGANNQQTWKKVTNKQTHMWNMGYWPSLFGQDGWILAKFFFCVFMDRDEVEVHKHAKKERGQYPAILTEQAWSIKDLLYGIKHLNMINFPCGTKPVSRAGKIAPSCPLG